MVQPVSSALLRCASGRTVSAEGRTATRRVLTRRRRLPFEQAAGVWARRASWASNASSLTRPLSEQGRQARGWVVDWMRRFELYYERGLLPLWQGFHKAADKDAWVSRLEKIDPLQSIYYRAIWHMLNLIRRGGSDLELVPADMVNRYLRVKNKMDRDSAGDEA